MVPWTTVRSKKKKPGSSGGAQEGQEKASGEVDVQAGTSPRFLSKIRAEFTHSGKNGGFKASAEAKQLCGHLLRIDPNIAFTAENDVSTQFSKIADFPTGANKFQEFFPITSYNRNDGSGKVQINILIESERKLADIKSDTIFMKYLRDKKIWMTEHKYETHSLQAIGYIVKKAPKLTNRQQFEADLRSAFTDHLENACDEGNNNNLVPDMEIHSKKITHVLRDSSNKKIGLLETQALEVRCESANAQLLKKLLCTADLSEHFFGKFVPYELLKNDQAVVKRLINDHNKFLSEIKVISLFGLHQDVLESLVPGETATEDDEPFLNRLLGKEVVIEDEDSGESYSEPLILAIEKTQRSDDLGKWYIITTHENASHTENLIDQYLIPTAEQIVAYTNHSNDNESFKLGIRRTISSPDTVTTMHQRCAEQCSKK